jgi:hypothetical protein
VQGMPREGKNRGQRFQPITLAHVPAPAKPSTTVTKRTVSILVRVQAVGSIVDNSKLLPQI